MARSLLIFVALQPLSSYTWNRHTHTHSQLYRIPRAATPRSINITLSPIPGLPTDRLTPAALACCQQVGSSSTTVGDIIDRGGGDHKVLRMIQKAVDNVNKKAASKISKVGCRQVWIFIIWLDVHGKCTDITVHTMSCDSYLLVFLYIIILLFVAPIKYVVLHNYYNYVLNIRLLIHRLPSGRY